MCPGSLLRDAFSHSTHHQWHRLYSSLKDGRSFPRLAWSVLGYSGASLVVIQTTAGGILGAFTAATWKDSRDFYGTSEGFLFQLNPEVKLYYASGRQEHYCYLHNGSKLNHSLPPGLGFGGSLSKPRLFVPASFEGCSAESFDLTYDAGNLVAPECLEKFEIQTLEVWAVGQESVEGLEARAAHRERTTQALDQARRIRDKSAFADDMKSGLIPNELFAHREQARGRHDFSIDDVHGGYKVDSAS